MEPRTGLYRTEMSMRVAIDHVLPRLGHAGERHLSEKHDL
jgi:hypothetical protein